MSESISVAGPRRRMPRTRGATGGVLLVLLGAWGGLAPFVGPLFNFGYTPDDAWHWTAARGWLEVLPGGITIIGGVLLVASASRATTVAGAVLGIVGGAWFVIGLPLAGPLRLGTPGVPLGTDRAQQAMELLALFTGLGGLVLIVASAAFGRLSVVTVRDAEAAARRERAADEAAAEQAAAEQAATEQAAAEQAAAEQAAAERVAAEQAATQRASAAAAEAPAAATTVSDENGPPPSVELPPSADAAPGRAETVQAEPARSAPFATRPPEPAQPPTEDPAPAEPAAQSPPPGEPPPSVPPPAEPPPSIPPPVDPLVEPPPVWRSTTQSFAAVQPSAGEEQPVPASLKEPPPVPPASAELAPPEGPASGERYEPGTYDPRPYQRRPYEPASAEPSYDSAAEPSYDSAAEPSYDSAAEPSCDSAAEPSYDPAAEPSYEPGPSEQAPQLQEVPPPGPHDTLELPPYAGPSYGTLPPGAKADPPTDDPPADDPPVEGQAPNRA